MHLKHIKLSGFKSFAEPTQIPVPGRLIGIVGPNGCGKSNVIDAVRWVLGESQAKHLRGETLQDVIFGGTADRKPQGRASVELVFDNTDGRAPGQWSQYAEIAVRRVLARDGVSNYYINNTHVRRRDVQDIFLGTGLGPRAYAIIEQGMISRIVESKPEEIRVFLEEAAGISKYKERRRETELRLADTRNHLGRTEDIRRELGGQIEKLAQQAEVARVYHELKSELARNQNLLLFSRRRDAEAARARALRELEKTEVELEAETAQLRESERLIEESRQAHYRNTDAVNAAQGEVYQANSEVSRAENALQTARNEQRRRENEMASLRQEIAADEARQAADEAQLAQHRAALERATELLRVGQLRVTQERQGMPVAEALVRERREALDAVRKRQANCENELSAARSETTAAKRLLAQILERRVRLEAERAQWAAPDARQMATLSDRLREQEVRCTILNAAVESASVRLNRLESSVAGVRELAETRWREQARLEAELNALETLQSRLNVNQGAQALVQKHGLSDLPQFWQGIEVDSGWELAVEAALGLRLNAFRVEDLSLARDWSGDDIPPGVALYRPLPETDREVASSGAGVPHAAAPLTHRVTAKVLACAPALSAWLQDIHAADSLSDALALSGSLPRGVTLATPDGHLVTRDSLVFFSPQGEFHGALGRAREIEIHQQALNELTALSIASREALEQAEAALEQVRESRSGLVNQAREADAARHAFEVERTRLQGLMERYQQRSHQWQTEWQELEAQEKAEQAVLARGEAGLASAQEAAAGLVSEAESTDAAWREADRARETQRAALQSAERALQESVYLEKTARERIQNLETAQRATGERLAQRKPRLDALEAEQVGHPEAPLAEALQAALGERVLREQALQEARVALDNAANALRELEERRLATQQRIEPLRNRLGELRLKEQEARLGLEAAEASLQENHANLVELAELAEKNPPRTSVLQAEIQRLNQEVEALGPVNLAALAELESAQERKTWLDAQAADLEQAVATLEDAMRKIDRETREQLRGTFDRVNQSFSTLFPGLFGGGYARIELTGEEILDAGVQIVAQPPGKKTTSIHLLSGGEKALTAISLVFALFQLNPAPFCILDEVDAPLDDNNTERFANLVKKMAEQTQFLFITHNKIAMEMAQQLVGITMAESGVSRMVAVDIDEAIRMTESVAA